VRRVAGYKKIRYYTLDNVGYGSVNLPDQEMHTTALWWQIAANSLAYAFPNRSQAIDGFLGAAYALHTIACLLSMCERNDLGRAVGDGSGDWFATTDVHGRGKLQSTIGDQIDLDARRQFTPTLFLYDNYPGGIGLAPSLYDMRPEIVARAAALVSECACQFGCPACVGPILASDEARQRSAKAAAIKVLSLLADVPKNGK
jgi:DEAD/DEAH box helicase domain-containing protein